MKIQLFLNVRIKPKLKTKGCLCWPQIDRKRITSVKRSFFVYLVLDTSIFTKVLFLRKIHITPFNFQLQNCNKLYFN